MGGQFPERIALGLSKDMLAALQLEARQHGRTLLAQIRYFCEKGLQERTKIYDLEKRIEVVETTIRAAETEGRYDLRGTGHQGKTVKKGTVIR